MSIPENTNQTLTGVTSLAVESEAEKRAKDSLHLQQLEQTPLLGIISLILKMLGMDGDLDSPEFTKFSTALSGALGADSSVFNNTIKDFAAGNTGLYDAATKISSSIDYSKTNPEEAFRVLSTANLGGNLSGTEYQNKVFETIDKAAEDVGVSKEYMVGLFGVESTFGTALMSPTGCEGPFQFSQATWDDMMKKHGDDIADFIRDEDPALAQRLDDNHMRKGSLNDLQYDPVVATYASAFYNKENAGVIGINPMDQSSWGKLYAAYNVGPGNSKRLHNMAENGDQRSALAVIGKVARQNPMFYKGGVNAETALSRYQGSIEGKVAQFNQKFSDPNQQLAAEEREQADEQLAAADTNNNTDTALAPDADQTDRQAAFNGGGETETVALVAETDRPSNSFDPENGTAETAALEQEQAALLAMAEQNAQFDPNASKLPSLGSSAAV